MHTLRAVSQTRSSKGNERDPTWEGLDVKEDSDVSVDVLWKP